MGWQKQPNMWDDFCTISAENVPMWCWLDDSLGAVISDLNEMEDAPSTCKHRADQACKKMAWFQEVLALLMDISERILQVQDAKRR